MKALAKLTPDELGTFVDSHLIMALEAADLLHGDRQEAEDLVRNRLVAISDSYDRDQLPVESTARTMRRLIEAVQGRD